jgi:undecaprenyl-diphosphatase
VAAGGGTLTLRRRALRNASLGAAAATVALAAATRTRGLQDWDDAVERAVGRVRRGLHGAARVGTLPGEPWAHPFIGAAIAITILARRGGRRRRVVVPLAGASLGAIALHHAVKAVYRRKRPMIALRRGKTEPAFPSGHTTDATAVLATGAYLLIREGILSRRVAIPVATALAVTTGASRVALGWHWGTDVLGGWLAGATVAAACAHTYEALKR